MKDLRRQQCAAEGDHPIAVASLLGGHLQPFFPTWMPANLAIKVTIERGERLEPWLMCLQKTGVFVVLLCKRTPLLFSLISSPLSLGTSNLYLHTDVEE